MRKIFSILLFNSALWIFLFVSCPLPFTEDIVNNAKDNIIPEITIIYPVEGSICANIAEIRGRVRDLSTPQGAPGRIASLDYEVPGTIVKGPIVKDEEGFFSFRFITATLSTSFTMNITAIDGNGNPAIKELPLKKIENNGIPSFKAIPGNQKITLQWEPVPGAESYTVYYTSNKSLPGEENGVTIDIAAEELTEQGFVLAELDNGYLYTFLIKANKQDSDEDWLKNRSGFVSTIPLSPQNLATYVKGEFRQNRIEWSAIPGTDEYEVWRSLSPDGTYSNLSGPIKDLVYSDTNTNNGQWYYYKVKPALENTELSMYNGAENDPFFTDRLELVGSYDTPRSAYSFSISGSYAYVVTDSGFQIINISDPANPVLTNSLDTLNDANSVVINGSYAYVATDSGLQIISISDSAYPVLLGFCNTPGRAMSVSISGNYAYVLDWALEFQIINISDPGTFPAEVLPNLQIIDISDPVHPVLTGSYDTQGRGYRVSISGSYAYVATDSGLQIINIFDPANPVFMGSYDTPGGSYNVSISGSYVYVAANSGLQIINIFDPANPVLMGSYDTHGQAYGVSISESYAYLVAESSDFQIINIFDPANPVLEASYNIPGHHQRISANTLVSVGDSPHISGSLVYIGTEFGLYIINISAPGYPILAGSYTTLGSAYDVSISGSYAYVAFGPTYPRPAAESGLYIINISDPAQPMLASLFETEGFASDVSISGSYAYVANYFFGLQIINISDPAQPMLASLFETEGSALGVSLSGSYAYVAADVFGLYIINISDPVNPVLVGSCDTFGSACGVSISGSYAYIADSDSGLQIINISDPAHPVLVGSYATLGSARGVSISGSYAYVAADSSGLQIINISDPADPILVKSYNTQGDAYNVSISEKYAYIAINDRGLQIINISNPAEPRWVSWCNTPGDARGVSISGRYAYMADSQNGLQIINLMAN